MSNYYNDLVRVRCPESLVKAVAKGAAKQMMTESEYVRRAMIEKLQADGIKISDASPS